jgi:hypothetical protein
VAGLTIQHKPGPYKNRFDVARPHRRQFRYRRLISFPKGPGVFPTPSTPSAAR